MNKRGSIWQTEKTAVIQMKSLINPALTAFLIFLTSCQSGRALFDPVKKYPSNTLKEDFTIFRKVLEKNHPGLYWFTPKDSMDYYFDSSYRSIRDSMTEPQFKNLLSYVTAKIDCGHTSVRYSKKFSHYLDTAKIKLFPFGIKAWEDTLVATINLNRWDSRIKRGSQILSIDAMPAQKLIDTFFEYTVTDAYSMTGKYQSISNGFNFGSLYTSLFGIKDSLDLVYYDDNGVEKQEWFKAYDQKSDSNQRFARINEKKDSLKTEKKSRNRQFQTRSIEIDTASSIAYMTLATFSNGNRLRKFFRKSFRTLDKRHIRNLIIDLRSNGGGDAGNSTLLTRYIIDKKFKLADSLYANNRHSNYDKYVGNIMFYRMLMVFLTKKEEDGKYHFGYFERHYFHPKSSHHYGGDVYLMTGGNSFSATTLFTGAIKGQKNVTIVGEETGGSYYGNNAWMIPDATLPNTGIRFRLPLFHLVVDRNRIKDGHGVMPDVTVVPTLEAIKYSIDYKGQKVLDLIRLKNATGNALVR